MKPGMQFNATKPLKAAEKALKAFGIAFESRRMKDISEPPDWADTFNCATTSKCLGSTGPRWAGSG